MKCWSESRTIPSKVSKASKTFKLSFLLSFGLALCMQADAQDVSNSFDSSDSLNTGDSTIVEGSQSVVLIDSVERHSPSKAALRAALVPGWGQAYNRKYWKIPIVYAGLGALGYWVYFNADQHAQYRQALDIRNDGDSLTVDDFSFLSESQIISIKDFYRRQLDLSILLSVAFYGLQIVDAVVDAHLYEFDVSDDLSLRWQPYIEPRLFRSVQSPNWSSSAGVHLQLRFK